MHIRGPTHTHTPAMHATAPSHTSSSSLSPLHNSIYQCTHSTRLASRERKERTADASSTVETLCVMKFSDSVSNCVIRGSSSRCVEVRRMRMHTQKHTHIQPLTHPSRRVKVQHGKVLISGSSPPPTHTHTQMCTHTHRHARRTCLPPVILLTACVIQTISDTS